MTNVEIIDNILREKGYTWNKERFSSRYQWYKFFERVDEDGRIISGYFITFNIFEKGKPWYDTARYLDRISVKVEPCNCDIPNGRDAELNFSYSESMNRCAFLCDIKSLIESFERMAKTFYLFTKDFAFKEC